MSAKGIAACPSTHYIFINTWVRAGADAVCTAVQIENVLNALRESSESSRTYYLPLLAALADYVLSEMQWHTNWYVLINFYSVQPVSSSRAIQAVPAEVTSAMLSIRIHEKQKKKKYINRRATSPGETKKNCCWIQFVSAWRMLCQRVWITPKRQFGETEEQSNKTEKYRIQK